VIKWLLAFGCLEVGSRETIPVNWIYSSAESEEQKTPLYVEKLPVTEQGNTIILITVQTFA
jgi:hypothetical protein